MIILKILSTSVDYSVANLQMQIANAYYLTLATAALTNNNKQIKLDNIMLL